MTNEEKILKEIKEKAGRMFTDDLERYSNVASSPRVPQPRGCWWKAILVFLGPIFLMFIWDKIDKSDIFQRTINPPKYWRTQVAILEQDIYKTELSIKKWSTPLPAKDKADLVDYDQLVRIFIIQGKEPEEAKNDASKAIKEISDAEIKSEKLMIKLREDILRDSAMRLELYKQELENAKKELAKY